MEEKLRNLSQNIENNTGEHAHKPEETPPPENHEEREEHDDHHEEPREEHHEKHEEETPWEEEDVSDYTPEPEDEKEPEKQPEPELEPEPEPEPESEPEFESESEPEPKPSKDSPSDSSSAKILTINVEDDEPKESPTRTKKYSPEVEAALNRLNAEDSTIDFDSEPLSTEPKKQHHGGRIFLVILLILAIAAATLCILVEQKIIDNPLNLIGGKKTETSQEETKKPAEPIAKTTDPVALTDETLIKAIDAIFAKNVETDNYYVFARTSQTLNGKNYVYYDVAELPATDCAAETNCADVIKVTAENYKEHPEFRYSFIESDFDVYEFKDRAPLAESKVVDDVTKNLDDQTEEKK